ncbi:hypothetical protein KAX02_05995, partial [candidate division WOR-3 bacterium]|nr:hypothetical protein [candidate division WOR-3 bacterium]
MKIFRELIILTPILILTSSISAKLYQFTETGSIAMSSDNGVSWSWVGNIGVSDAKDVAADSSRRLYLITESGDLARSTDYGVNWSFVGSMSQADACGLEFDSGDTLYVVTGAGDVFRSINYGTSFSLISSIGLSNVIGITEKPTDTLCVVTRTGDLARSTDKGQTWTILSNVGASDITDIIALPSGLYVITETGDVAKSTDYSSWSWVGTLSQVSLIGITFDDEGNLFIGTNTGDVATSTVGVSWTWKGTASQVWMEGITTDWKRGPTITVAGTNIAPIGVTPGDKNIGMTKLELSTNDDAATWTKIKIKNRVTSGTPAASDIDSMKIYRDNGDVSFNTVTDTWIGSSTVTDDGSGGYAEIDITNQTITTTTGTFYIVYDIADGANPTHFAGVRLDDRSFVTVSFPARVSITGFPIQLGDMALPVILSSFEAISGDGMVILIWVTQSEIGTDKWIIERSLDEEGTYQNIGSKEAQGSTPYPTEYEFVDNTVINGTTYWYRLALMDLNGTVTYYGPIYATPEPGQPAFFLFQNLPNPFT